MVKLVCLLAFGAFLAVLVPLPAVAEDGGLLRSAQTGIVGVYTGQTVISSDAHHVLVGHIIVAGRGAERHIALIIQHRRDGVHYLSFSAAHSGGIELPFRRMTSHACGHGHCRDRTIGLIALSPEMVQRFAETGLHARLTGRSGAIDLHVPMRLFSEALDRAASAGMPGFVLHD